MPDFDDFLDLDDDIYWDEELGVDIRTLRGADFRAWVERTHQRLQNCQRESRELELQVRDEIERRVVSECAEIAALSALNWRTPSQQRRLENLRGHLEGLPPDLRRLGPPPWPRRVVDVVKV